MAGIFDDIMNSDTYASSKFGNGAASTKVAGSNKTGKMGALANGVANVGSSFVNSFAPIPEVGIPDAGGFGNRVDTSGLRGMEFKDSSFDVGNVFGSAASGASAGAAFGPLGGAIGAAAGGLLGLGGSLVKQIKQKRAESEFESNRKKAIRDAMFVNSSIGTRERIMKNLAGGARSQADKFYSNFGI